MIMACKSCDDYKTFDVCIICGEINKPISQNIQDYYTRLEKSAHPNYFVLPIP